MEGKISRLLICVNFLFLLYSSVAAIKNIGEYNEYMQKLATDKEYETVVSKYLEKWTKQYNDRFDSAKDVNDVTGVSKYSCPVSTDTAVPTSVNALRPQDIKVIGALGDSLTAGFGAGANSIFELIHEYRGLAFSIGGDGDLKYSTTLPNILRYYNPFLVGASHRVSPVWFEYFAQNNVAISGAYAADLKSEAEELVRRIKESNELDFEKDWKLVTVFIGSNDLCNYCEDRVNLTANKYLEQLKEAIGVLYEKLPRTLVSVVNNEHVNQLEKTHKSSIFCNIVHKKACPCAVAKDSRETVKSYQKATESLSNNFQDKEDFTVVVQDFAVDAIPPTLDGTDVDLAFFAPDCFHFSHWGHSIVGKALWNNMLEPVGAKTRTFLELLDTLKCPDKSCPFIRTNKNSKDCSVYVNPHQQVKMESIKAAQLPMSMDGNPLVLPKKHIKMMRDEEINKSTEPEQMELADIFRPKSPEDSVNYMALIIALAVMVIVAMAVGSVTYNACVQYKRRKRERKANEKTPLLNNDDDLHVQVY